MNPPRLVIDAGVVVGWFVPEEHGGPAGADDALRLLDLAVAGRLALAAPELVLAESANVLWKLARLRGYPIGAAERAVHAILDVPLELHRHGRLLPDALEIAFRYQRTVCDSLYVALALRQHAPLVTTDRRLATALAPSFPAVRTLETVFAG